MEEEYVCISKCTKSITNWKLLLLLAVLNLDQKSAVSGLMPRKHTIWFYTLHSTAINGTRSYSERVSRRGTSSHCICTQRDTGSSVKSQILAGSLSAVYCLIKRQTFLAPDDFLLQAGLSVICERKIHFVTFWKMLTSFIVTWHSSLPFINSISEIPTKTWRRV